VQEVGDAGQARDALEQELASLEALLGSRAKVRDLLRLYVSTSEPLVAELHAAVARRDAAAAAQLAHQLKGASGYLGVREVERLCRQLEQTLDSADWSAADLLIPRLEAAFRDATAFAAAF